ncbi:MAG: plasmid recombination protein [Clostridia bacterium]|nr:plasmid recombination protein [Clostridia bacterium]
MEKIVCMTSNINSESKLKAAQTHNRREKECANADPAKTPQNKVLSGPPAADYKAIANERYAGIAIVKGSVIAKDFVIAVDRMEQATNPNFSINAFCSICTKWALESFGRENIIDMVLHIDEHAPHIHMLTTTTTNSGIISVNEFMRERGGLSHLQTDLASRLAPLGLIRGLESGRFHSAGIRKEFYPDIQKAGNLAIPSPVPGQSMDDYVRTVKGVFVKSINDYKEEIAPMSNKIIDASMELERLGCGSKDEYMGLFNDCYAKFVKACENKEDLEFCTAIQRALTYGLLRDEQLIDTDELYECEYDQRESFDYDEYER